MPTGAVAGALREMNETSDAIPALKEHTISNKNWPCANKDQNKTAPHIIQRWYLVAHPELGAEMSLKAGMRSSASLHPALCRSYPLSSLLSLTLLVWGFPGTHSKTLSVWPWCTQPEWLWLSGSSPWHHIKITWGGLTTTCAPVLSQTDWIRVPRLGAAASDSNG